MSSDSGEHRTEDRITPCISSTIKKISDDVCENPNSKMGEVFQDFLLEQEILKINDKNVDKIFTLIQEKAISYNFIALFTEHAIKIRPLQSDCLFSLLAKISKVTPYTPYRELIKEHRKALIQKGIINDDDDEEDEEEAFSHDFEEQSIESAIREDSVDKLIEISSHYDFNPQRKIKYKYYHSVCFVTDNIYNNFKEDIEVTYMQLMAFYRSVKCFKYALIDGSFDESGLIDYAIAGGNYEIIHLIEQKGVSFDYCFETSIKYHRNDLSDWLLRNYECETLSPSLSIDYFNVPAFFFHFNNVKSSSDDYLDNALISSSSIGFLSLVKYFIDEGANIEATDSDKRTSLLLASKYGNLDVVKYLIDKGANIEAKSDFFEFTPLIVASDSGCTDIIRYLIGKGANIEAKDDIFKKTSLHYACEVGDIDTVKCLIDLGANIEAKDEFGKTPLEIAMKEDELDIVEYFHKGANKPENAPI